MTLPSDYAARKAFPLLTVLAAYFPDAIEALVELCKQGNVQHNVTEETANPFKLPGDAVTWDRSKSTDQMNTLMRHVWDHERARRGVGDMRDVDGVLHIIKAFWRAGAEAQLTLESLRKPTTLTEITAAGHGEAGPHGTWTFGPGGGVDPDLVGELTEHEVRQGLLPDHSPRPRTTSTGEVPLCEHGYIGRCMRCVYEDSYGGTD